MLYSKQMYDELAAALSAPDFGGLKVPYTVHLILFFLFIFVFYHFLPIQMPERSELISDIFTMASVGLYSYVDVSFASFK